MDHKVLGCKGLRFENNNYLTAMVPDNIADILEGGTPDLSASKEAATPSTIPLLIDYIKEGLSINRLTDFS